MKNELTPHNSYQMKKFTLILLVFSLLTNTTAQNLIPNYSFEDVTSCPTWIGQLSLASPWYAASASPDLFNVCATDITAGVPTNGFGFQNPVNGEGYAGLYTNTVSSTTSGGEEYLMTFLDEPLEAGACYYGELYVSLAETVTPPHIGISGLGMYFTNGLPPITADEEIVASPPQIYGNYPITEKQNWTLISGIFIADGTEDHVTVGHMLADSETLIENLVPNPVYYFPYYYIDDVTLIKLNSTSNLDFTICQGECFSFLDEEFCEEGTFSVSLAGCNGATGNITLNISVSPSTEIEIAPIVPLDCNNPSIALDASGSSYLPSAISYEWTGPDNFSSSQPIVNVMDPGWYTFSVISSQRCRTKDSIEVVANYETPELSIAPPEDWDCVAPSITVSSSSTTAGVTYQWIGPGINEPSSSINVNLSGIYQLTITGPNGCTETGLVEFPLDYFTIPEVNINPVEILDCNNTIVNLEGSSNLANPSYLWTGLGLSENTSNAQTSQSGTFSLTVTTIAGCSTTNTIEVLENFIEPDVFAFVSSTVDCTLGFITLEGMTSNGNPNYLWEGPGILEPYESANVYQPGVYTFTVTDQDNGCTATDEITLTEEEFAIPQFIDFDQPNVITCANSGTILYGSTDAIDPTYLWIGPGLNDSNQSSYTEVPGVYTLIVNNATGCELIDSIEVTGNITPPDLLITGIENLDCNNSSTILVGSSSSLNVSYAWESPTDIIQNDSIVVNFPGVYTLEVTNLDNQCSATEQIEIFANPDLPTSDAGADGILDCIAASYDLDGSNSTGDDLSFLWFDSNDVAIGNTQNITVTSSDVYTLLVTNGTNGCTSIDQVNVTQDAAVPTSNAGADGVLDCTAASYTLDGSNSQGNDLSFLWFDSNDVAIGNTQNITVTSSDVYTLLVTNGTNGCTSIDQVNVTQDIEAPTADAGDDGLITCINSTYNLDGSNSTGANLIYTWYNSAGVLISNNIIFTTDVINDYTLIVTNQENGCTSTDEVSIFENIVTPLASAEVDGFISCVVEEVTLSSGSSPGNNLSFSWFNDIGILLGNAESLMVSGDGNYTLVVTDLTNGCEQIDTVEVLADLESPDAFAATLLNLTCNDDIGLVSGVGSSSGLDYEYLWSGTGNISSPTELETEVAITGIYQLEVKDNTNGCTSTAETEVIQNSDFPGLPQVNVSDPNCIYDAANLVFNGVSGGTAPYSYSIDDGVSFENNNLFTGLLPGFYNLVIQDQEGCQYLESIVIPEGTELLLDLDPVLNLDYGINEQIMAEVNLPLDQIASIEWSPSFGLSCSDCLHPFVLASQSTRYQLTVKTVNGCNATAPIEIRVDKKQDIYIPTAFSPNGDGKNDVFMIYSESNAVRNINSFRIFDRWGELVFEQVDALPNNTAYAWDGIFRGKPLNVGTFVYSAEVVWNDGRIELLKGDVVLIK